MSPDPARHPAWRGYRDRLRRVFAEAGGDDEARRAVVAAVVRQVEPRACLGELGGALGVAVPAPGPGLLCPELAGLVLEDLQSPVTRRQAGVHHTPPPIAGRLVAVVLEPGIGHGRTAMPAVCDPAVGGGVFLLAAARALRRAGIDPGCILQGLFGADLDPLAAATTRAALRCWAFGEGVEVDDRSLAYQIVVGDGLGCDVSLWPTAPPEGFDVVLGNPPFMGQLGTATARDTATRRAHRSRFGDAASGYADTAGLFLVTAMGLARPGGRVAMIQPESLLAARDGALVRRAVDEAGGLTDLWVARGRVFDASVRVCAPALTVGHRSPSVRRYRGAEFELLAPGETRVDTEDWGHLALAAYGTPEVSLPATVGTLGQMATATAGFRDQFYGLAPHVIEASEFDHDHDRARLVTVGSIDPLWCAWGQRPTKFAGRRHVRPVVDLASLTENAPLLRWVQQRLVPKVLVASQTRVVEVVVDTAGILVPSVPVVAVAADEADLWAVAAALLAPPVSAWALARGAGTALAADAVKLSAKQVLEIPLPVDHGRWRAASQALSTGDEGSPAAFGAAMCQAYGLAADDAVLAWWIGRLRTWRGQPVVSSSVCP